MPKILKKRGRGGKANGVTGATILKGMKKHCVRDDGYCWLYVVMSILGLYKPTVKRGRINAPDPDMSERLGSRALCAALQATDSILFHNITKAPDYEGLRDPSDFLGTYGGITEWQALVEMLPIAVILWDPRNAKNMNDPDRQFYIVQNIEGKGIAKKLNPGEIQADILKLPSGVGVVHAAWSNTINGHFDVYM